jgi:RimJ/RimL family protein N-acetyltransferase
VSVGRIDVTDAASMRGLIEAYEFKPYRNYRVLSRRRQAEVLSAEISRTLAAPDSFAAAARHDDREAVAVCRLLPWDSAFFGVRMARLDYVLRTSADDHATIGAAVAGALDWCRQNGVQHVAARLDVADTTAIAALEARGFRLMDALVTYVYHPKRPPPPPVKEVGALRPFTAADTEQIVEITREAYRGFRGRFHLDPHLPKERSDELYIEWARQCCSGAMADRIYVAEDRRGRLHGWASVRLVQPVSAVGGVRIFAGSLGACRRDHPGAYAGLIRTAAAQNHASSAVTEAQTQNYNFPTVRVYEAVGAQYVRADYTFHAWLE